MLHSCRYSQLFIRNSLHSLLHVIRVPTFCLGQFPVKRQKKVHTTQWKKLTTQLHSNKHLNTAQIFRKTAPIATFTL